MPVGVEEGTRSGLLGVGLGCPELPAAASISPQAVLAGAVAFIYEKRGGTYWVRGGVEVGWGGVRFEVRIGVRVGVTVGVSVG